MSEKILVFDFDGTIADSLQLVVDIYNRLSPKYNLKPVTRDSVERLKGKSAREVISELKISKFKLPLMFIDGKREFNKSLGEVKIFPGMKDALLGLKKNYQLGVVTSNSVENVEDFLRINNLDCFNFIYSDKSLFGKGKVIKNLIKRYKFEPEQLIYIGDEVRDIEAARTSNIKIIAVSWGYNKKEILLKNKPDAVVYSPDELLATIKVVGQSVDSIS